MGGQQSSVYMDSEDQREQQRVMSLTTDQRLDEFREQANRKKPFTDYLLGGIGWIVIVAVLVVLLLAAYQDHSGGSGGSCTEWDVTAGGAKVCIAGSD